jgi:hypothetical protein
MFLYVFAFSGIAKLDANANTGLGCAAMPRGAACPPASGVSSIQRRRYSHLFLLENG